MSGGTRFDRSLNETLSQKVVPSVTLPSCIRMTHAPLFRVPGLVESRPVAGSPHRRSRSLPGHLPQAAPGEVLAWTDGACQRNPGPGGWAAVVSWEDGVVEEYSGGLPHTTNNIMEMTAALEGLRALPPGSLACIVTDSRYLHDGMTSWISGWKRRDWKTASGDPVKNKEIWVQLTAAASGHERVRWHWVRGHTGHALNERADVLAVAAARNAARSVR